VLNRARSQAYVARVSTGSSLIVHVLAHFARPDGQTCLIMNNWLPVRSLVNCSEPRACAPGPTLAAARAQHVGALSDGP